MSKAQTFLREAKAELGKVTWPDKKATIGATGVVIVVSLIIGVYLGILDAILSQVFEYIFGR